MHPHYHEWLDLIVRWIHLTVGIAWIGASFYFNWLENNLNRTFGLREGLAGNLWAVHGGGFYYLEKYKIAPPKLPEELHWFKWEAYFTWISGFCMLIVVYYMQPSAHLVDPRVSSISGPGAVCVGISSLVFGWIVYDLLCKSALGRLGWQFAAVGFVLITGVSFGLSQILSARAAYLHVGALIGTMMVGNVFKVIIPSQKALVDAAITGNPLDPQLGTNALRRSRHNNYLTLPVLFIMLSTHFPSTHGNPHSWAILSAIVFIGVSVRHYFNIRKRNPKSIWILPAALVGIFGLAVYTAPSENARVSLSQSTVVNFARVRAIIAGRCTQCHSATPSDDIFKAPPNGIAFDTPEQIIALAERIRVRAVDLKTMPLINKTGMTDEERAILARWFELGATTQ